MSSDSESDGRQKRLKDLRTALAVNRGMALIDDVAEKNNKSSLEYHESRMEGFLTREFVNIHRELFKDWRKQPNLKEPGEKLREPGKMVDAKVSDALRAAIHEHLLSNGDKRKNHTKLFDDNGFIIGAHEDIQERRTHCAEILAEFYDALRNIHAFDYGNKLTRDFLMVELGKLPEFKAVYATDIDLRRLKEEDVKILHTKSSSKEQLREVFTKALNPDLTPVLDNMPNGYDPWAKHVEYIANIRFLSHEDNKHGPCLVTVNGGLVPLNVVKDEMEASLRSGKLLAEAPAVRSEQIVGYLPETEKLRDGYDQDGVKYIDGFRTTQKEAPLVCLDVDIITGLRGPSVDELMDMLAQCRGKGTPVFALNKNEKMDSDIENDRLMSDLFQLAGNDSRKKRTIEIAYEHVNHMTRKLNALTREAFDGKKPVDDPKLFATMGGAGAGKSNVEDMVNEKYGKDKVVVTSLDVFREKCDLHLLLKKANHHADDYEMTSPFGNALRDWVAAYARGEGPDNPEKKKYNLLYDGSGIVYQPRYSQLIGQFKNAGFNTEVIAFDRDYLSAVKHVISRGKKESRGVPWKIVASKHSLMPRSVLQAVEDSNLDKFSLYANDGKKGQHRLIAQTFDGNSLAADKPQVSRDDNVANLSYTVKGENRTLSIYDVDRFIKLLDKGLINPYASGARNVYSPSASFSFMAGGDQTWGERIKALAHQAEQWVAAAV